MSSMPTNPPHISPEDDSDLRSHEESLLALIEALGQLEVEFQLGVGFNVFEAVAMARQEIRHSRFLAFLLNPRSPHGLGPEFLRAILSAAVAEHPEPPVSRLDVAITDLSSSTVHCERDHFDIAVEISSLRLLFVIENKIDAAESADQLQKYRKRALSRYQDYRFMGTFLTPTGYEGEDDNWGTMGYATVIAELKATLFRTAVPPDVEMAIGHYIQLIERKIVASQALIEACKSIYQQHRTAVDLLVQYGQESQLSQAFDQFISAKGGQLETTALRSNTATFLFGDWLKIPNFPEADRKRWSSTFPVVLWFAVGVKGVYLRLEVGPFVEAEKRQPIVDALREKLKSANSRTRKKGAGNTYTRIVTFSTSISEDPEVGELVDAMEKLWQTAEQHQLKETVRGVLTSIAAPPPPIPQAAVVPDS